VVFVLFVTKWVRIKNHYQAEFTENYLWDIRFSYKIKDNNSVLKKIVQQLLNIFMYLVVRESNLKVVRNIFNKALHTRNNIARTCLYATSRKDCYYCRRTKNQCGCYVESRPRIGGDWRKQEGENWRNRSKKPTTLTFSSQTTYSDGRMHLRALDFMLTHIYLKCNPTKYNRIRLRKLIQYYRETNHDFRCRILGKSVYIIFQPYSRKSYIGTTVDLNSRMYTHFRRSTTGPEKLYADGNFFKYFWIEIVGHQGSEGDGRVIEQLAITDWRPTQNTIGNSGLRTIGNTLMAKIITERRMEKRERSGYFRERKKSLPLIS